MLEGFYLLAYDLHRKVSTTRQKVELVSSITAFGGPEHHGRETKKWKLYYIIFILQLKNKRWRLA
jgi:hypothetical protein